MVNVKKLMSKADVQICSKLLANTHCTCTSPLVPKYFQVTRVECLRKFIILSKILLILYKYRYLRIIKRVST